MKQNNEELNNKLNNIKDYFKEISLKKLNSRIYNLNLPDNYLKTLDYGLIQFIHVKLHNSMSFRKPFAKFNEIKIVHDRVRTYLKSHNYVDKLDENL